jgi:chromate transporter
VVLVAGMIGFCAPGRFSGGGHGAAKVGPPAAVDALLDADPAYAKRLARGARRAGLVALALWFLPVAVLMPGGGIFADVAWFFSRLAIVTFGGAYAVLAYAAQEAVQRYHWLSASEMLSGLGLAETTPGPLILVLQFVGFLAGYRAQGGLSGIAGGIAASVLTLWVTFAPCFTFVFLGAPLIERVQGNKALTGALAAITVGVVGVIANLAIWFALHALFRETAPVRAGWLAFDAPVLGSLDPWALLLSIIAAVALLRLGLGVIRTLAICSAAGVARYLATGAI